MHLQLEEIQKHAAVACTQGLLNMMTDEEIAGVLGHELGHVKHRDILIGTILATFCWSYFICFKILQCICQLVILTRMVTESNPLGLILMILAPIASVIQMTISRKREFLADRLVVEITGNPLYLRRMPLQSLNLIAVKIQMNQNESFSIIT